MQWVASILPHPYFTGVFAGVTADVPPEKTRAREVFETRGILVAEVASWTQRFWILCSRSTPDFGNLPFEILSYCCPVHAVWYGVNKHIGGSRRQGKLTTDAVLWPAFSDRRPEAANILNDNSFSNLFFVERVFGFWQSLA